MLRSGIDNYVTKERQRCPGGGRKALLGTDADRLLFILFYLNIYPIQEVQAYMFSMEQNQANYWMHRLAPVLKEALAELDMLPELSGERLEEVLQENERPVLVQDVSERHRNRPKDSKRQRKYYSGKKMAHTVKNHLVVHPESRRVCFLSKTTPGKNMTNAWPTNRTLPFRQ